MRLLPVAAILLIAAGCGTSSRTAATSPSQPAADKPAATAPATPEEAKAAEDKKAADAKAAEDKQAAEEKAAAAAAAKAKAAEDKKAADAKAAAAKAARSAPAQPASAGSWAMKAGGDTGGQFSELKVGAATLRLRYIPPGSYTQGSEPGDSPWRLDDEMAHQVTFSRGFWLAETETTQALYQAITGANPSQFTDPAKPVDSVSWDDAVSCINRLNGLFSGLDARLPSEAEWEYACRAGSTGPFAVSGGKAAKGAAKNVNAMGWTQEVSKGMTQPVGTLPGNAWGLHDMHGNLMEWCQDAYANYPASASDPKLVMNYGPRVVRGGSWRHPEWTARSAARRAIDSSVADNSLGFRILVPAKQ